MLAEEIDSACDLIAAAMNPATGAWARTTMQRHFRLKEIGVADGRHYFLNHSDDVPTGIVGLHHYEWGPPENVWLGWFAVAVNFQKRGLGSALMEEIQRRALAQGFTKLFVESYASPTFDAARKFYAERGFAEAGRVANYLPDGTDMVVFLKTLQHA